ncbi:MAG: hypothetical protein WCT05_09445 [Lentisphaeria bacterium]
MLDTLELLRQNSVFWSKLGFCYDPPRLGKDGKPIVFFDNWDQVQKYHRDFYQAGIRLHTSILFTGWTGVDQYDYELTDRVLETIFSCGKDLLYIPRIKLNVPIQWAKENPEELCVYWDGPRDVESIRALVGTEKHDLLGYQSARGYYTAGGWQDDRPNLGGVISNQSFSSRKWLQDAGEALRRILRRLEDGPYAHRIPAYHIAYGSSGESCVWGRCNVFNSADYGVAHRKMFYEWGIRRYGSLEVLRKAWCRPELTCDHLELPGLERKERRIRNMNEFFRAEAEDTICIDYDLFQGEINVTALEHFGKIVKKETGGKPVGAFYGYFLGVARATYTGYAALQKVLDSPYIDFLAAPKREGGGDMCPVQSVSRKKLWMDELDNRTNIARGTGFEYLSSSFSETKSIMWREFAKNLSHNASFWWMDLGGGWYDSPVLLAEIARIEKTASALRQKSAHSISEVCLVIDEMNFHYHKTSFYLHKCLIANLIDAMNRVGAPVDCYQLSDLDTLDVSNYKLFVFINTFRIVPEQWERISARLPSAATFLWYYAPGIRQNDKFSLDNIDQFLACQVRERQPDFNKKLPVCGLLQGTAPLQWPEHKVDDSCPVAENCPAFELEGELQPLAHYEDGAIAVGQWEHLGRKTIYSAVPLLEASHLRRILAAAGCRLYAAEGVLVYADSRFFALFSWQKCEFTLRLPGKGLWFEAVREEETGSEFVLQLAANESRVYMPMEGKK